MRQGKEDAAEENINLMNKKQKHFRESSVSEGSFALYNRTLSDKSQEKSLIGRKLCKCFHHRVKLCVLAASSRQSAASLPTSADHAERVCLGPGAGRRRPVLGRAGRSEAETRLQPGDLYPSAAAEGNLWLLVVTPSLMAQMGFTGE